MLQLFVLFLLHITPSTSDFGAIGSSSLGWLADELDDPSSHTLSSTYTDTSVFDFEIPFYSTGGGPIDLGVFFDSHLVVQRIDDSKAADLTGMIQRGDTLIAINEENVETIPLTQVTTKLKTLEETATWFWLTIRPHRLETRQKSELYDHNVTIHLKEEQDDAVVRLGLMLNSALKVHAIVEGSPVWADGLIKPNDLLVSIGDDIITGHSLAQVATILQSSTGSLRLRFRLSLEERNQKKKRQRQNQDQEQEQEQASSSSTYTIVFDTLQDLGLVIEDETLTVVAFSTDREHGGFPSPAEQTGKIRPGDVLVSIDGEEMTQAHQARSKVAQRTHQEVLRCRGGKVTRYCSIERIEPDTTKRVVVFLRGSNHYRRSAIMPSSTNGNEYGNDSTAAIDGTEGTKTAMVTDDDGSYYLEARKKAQLQRRTASTVLMPSGKHEVVFRAVRGAAHGIVGGGGGGGGSSISLDWSNSLFGGPLPCQPHNVIISSPLDGCSELNNPEKQIRNAYVVVRRGGCFFTSKAINAQYAGAAGLIVIDHPKRDLHGNVVGTSSRRKGGRGKGKDKASSEKGDTNTTTSSSSSSSSSIGQRTTMPQSLPERMPANAEDGHLVKIPAIAINHAAGEQLLTAAEVHFKATSTTMTLMLTSENGDTNCPDATQTLPRDERDENLEKVEEIETINIINTITEPTSGRRFVHAVVDSVRP